MRLRVNGKEIEFSGTSVLQLVERYKLKPKSVVVEKNGKIVKRENFKSESLKDGDVVEIVRFVGGG